MSKALLARPVPVGLLVRQPPTHEPTEGPAPPDPPADPVRPASWLWPAVVAVAFGPFVLTAVGLAAASLHPPARPEADPAYLPVAAPTIAPEPVPAVPADEEAAAEPAETPPPPVEAEPLVPVAPAPIVATPEPPKTTPVKAPRCDRFGTAIDFVRSPALAFDRAARDQKLVMVLHLAGYFDDPGFT